MTTAVASGAPAAIKTQADFAAWIPLDVAKLFWPRAKNAKGTSWVIGMQNTLRQNRTDWAGIETAYIFRLVPEIQTKAGVTVIRGGNVSQVGAQYDTAQPKSLAEANRYYAASLAAECPMQMILAAAPALNVRTDIDAIDIRAGVALQWALRATALRKSLPQIEREYAATGRVAGPDEAAPQAVRGTGSTASEFFKDVGDWIGGVIIQNLGRVLFTIGDQILRLRDSAPWLGKYFLDPLGFTAQAVLLEELGTVAYTGSISDFNEARFGMAMGQLFVAAGSALAIVAPLLPPPFNLAAAALAAISITLGSFMQNAIAENRRQREEAEEIKRLEAAEQQAALELREVEQAAAEEVEQAEAEVAALEEQARALEAETRAINEAAGIKTNQKKAGLSIVPVAVGGAIAALLTIGVVIFVAR